MHKVLESLDIGEGVQLARVVQAGRWFFAQGNMATVHAGGACAGARSDAPARLLSEPPSKAEATWIYENLSRHLGYGGAGLEDLVRLDQYYTEVAAVDPYHHVRHGALGRLIPPSTSVVMRGLLTPSAHVCVEALAMRGARDTREPVVPSNVPGPRASSGFVPALKAGGFIFVAGQMADAGGGQAIPSEATMDPDFVWDGTEIGRQTRYTLSNLFKTVEAAGSDKDHIVKAQVYLTDIEDLPGFDEVWTEMFGDNAPARTVVSATAFGLRRGIIEINLIAADSALKVERKPAERMGGPTHEPSVVSVEEFVFCSGLMARDGQDLDQRVAKTLEDRYVRSRAYVEMEVIIDQVEYELGRVGRRLEDLTRIIQFHTDLEDFLPMVKAWHDRLGSPVPVSAVQVPGPLPLKGATVLVDCWAVAE